MAIEIDVQRRLLDAVEALNCAAGHLENEWSLLRVPGLRRSLTEMKLVVAVVGEIGNGKSSVANALLAESVLPVGVAPITRALSRAAAGSSDEVRIVYPDGLARETTPEDLQRLSSEQVSRLSQLEYDLRSPFLSELELLDTPGLGDPEGPSSEEIDAVAFGAHCILCVLNADRLLSVTERDFIGSRLKEYGSDQLLFVLNRCDGKTADEVESLVDRAAHLLTDVVENPQIYPFSASRALKARLENDDAALAESDPKGLIQAVTAWSAESASILTAAVVRKIGILADRLESNSEEREADVLKALQHASEQSRAAAGGLARAREEVEDSTRRASAAMITLRDQIVVGLKEYTLQLRDQVPREVKVVPVDDARRYLPFFIQEALKTALEENSTTVREAIQQLTESLSAEARRTLEPTVREFRVELEPPAIPLYVHAHRAPLSHGANFVMAAGAAVMSMEFSIGCLLIAGSLLARELGKDLEAGDRRAALAASAQSLLHDSLDTIEAALRQQFAALETATRSAIEVSSLPLLAAAEERAAAGRASLQQAGDAQARVSAMLSSAQEELKRARTLVSA